LVQKSPRGRGLIRELRVDLLAAAATTGRGRLVGRAARRAFFVAATGRAATTGIHAAESIALGPSNKERQDDKTDDGRILEATEEELMDAGDIEQDGSDEEESEHPSARKDKEYAAEYLQTLDHGKVARAIHEAHKALRRRCALGREEVKPEVEAKDDKGQAKEERGDAGEFFHSPCRLG
jgi:hypothetical protein